MSNNFLKLWKICYIKHILWSIYYTRVKKISFSVMGKLNHIYNFKTWTDVSIMTLVFYETENNLALSPHAHCVNRTSNIRWRIQVIWLLLTYFFFCPPLSSSILESNIFLEILCLHSLSIRSFLTLDILGPTIKYFNYFNPTKKKPSGEELGRWTLYSKNYVYIS